MNKKLKLILQILGFAVVIAIAYFAYNALSNRVQAPQTPAVPSSQAVGSASSSSASNSEYQKIPDVKVYNAQGEEVALSSYIGKPLVINFWASWCQPCKIEMPHFEALSKEMAEDVTFLMINCTTDSKETEEKAKAFISESGYTFNVLYDLDGEAQYNFGVTSYPSTLLVDAEGNAIQGYMGAMSEQNLREAIELIK